MRPALPVSTMKLKGKNLFLIIRIRLYSINKITLVSARTKMRNQVKIRAQKAIKFILVVENSDVFERLLQQSSLKSLSWRLQRLTTPTFSLGKIQKAYSCLAFTVQKFLSDIHINCILEKNWLLELTWPRLVFKFGFKIVALNGVNVKNTWR